MVEQTKCFSVESVLEIYRDVVDRRGEGVMLRSDRLIWLPRRCGVVLKYKAWLDGEAKIVDTTLGEGRLDGLIGALTVRDCDSGLLFDIGTGMDDDFRKILPSKLEGHLCRYRYREKTDSGRPKEARFICLLD
jgi:DNA ligase-1